MSVRATLRARTADIHEALHGAVPFAAIAEHRLDVEGYVRLVLALHRYHASLADVVEAACARLRADAILAASARRRSRLRDDLRALGVSPASAAPVAVRSPVWAVGCLYTLAGSTLGGKVIYRQLDYLFDGATGRTFFGGSPDDSARWRELCDRIDAHGVAREILTETVDGAHFAFAHFASCLESHA